VAIRSPQPVTAVATLIQVYTLNFDFRENLSTPSLG